MSVTSALARIPVGVVVERSKAASQWIDFVWRPVAVLHGQPAAEPWTPLAAEGGVTTFYAGRAEVELFRSDTQFYRDNLMSGAPSLWVGMTPTDREPPYQILAVTADPAEGESFSEIADRKSVV